MVGHAGVDWLTWGSQIGQRVGSSAGRGRGTAPTSFPATVTWRPRVATFLGLVNGDAENIFGPLLDATAALTQGLPVTAVSPETAGTATLTVRMQGLTAGPHVVGVALNGSWVGSVTLADRENAAASFAVEAASLAAGATLTLAAQGGESDITFVDTVTLTYPRLYVADADLLRCTALSGQPVLITGFSASGVRVMDVTDPANATAPRGTVALQGDGSYGVSVVPQGGGRGRCWRSRMRGCARRRA